MSPKKEPRKKETDSKTYSIDDPINSDDWNCVVAMAVEKTFSDTFVLKAFLEEAVNGRRQQVKLINYDTFVMKILDDFANGELPYKYAFLLNFSSVFQEAAACISNQTDIPVPLLAKVIKALLFYLKEESLARAERKSSGPVDPVKAMAERPAHVGGTLGGRSKSKKELVDKKKKQTGNDKLTVRPPSMSKQDTKLLKKGEGIKEDQCIDDAPDDGIFQLYVLLTGFYHPELPLELIKAEVPLCIVLCVDTSLSEVRRIEPTQKRNSENRAEEIQNFWESFLKILWDPEISCFFNNTIFQVYVPKKLTCENVKEFIYSEICYLMYDISDLSKQLRNYLQNMKVWDVSGEAKPGLYEKYRLRMSGVGVECATVSVILQQMVELVSEEDATLSDSASVVTDSDVVYPASSRFNVSQSVMAKRGSWPVTPVWSQLLSAAEELSSLYGKTKELDVEYSLDEECRFGSSKGSVGHPHRGDSLVSCPEGSDNGVFASRWKNIQKTSTPILVDYSLYLLLLTRVVCLYDYTLQSEGTMKTSSSKNFRQIENLDDEMRKPHFTVTHGSRSIINGTPYNVKEASRDFFSPSQFKLVTPEKLKASSAPEFRSVVKAPIERSFVSELTYPLEYFSSKLTVFENVRKFLGEQMFEQVKGYDFLEEVNKTKLVARENEYVGSYNCIDCSYSIVADALVVVFHNRKGSDGTHHETFNGVLKTPIGLRDFYDYTLEDEADWLKGQEVQSEGPALTNTISHEGVCKNYTDSDFWLERSIKYQERLKLGSRRNISDNQGDLMEEENEDLNRPPSTASVPGEEGYTFHGYDISKAAVQFSGLKTVYYANDCSISVEVLERLYGDQHLGVHVYLGGHTLHLYSYICPQPHLNHPNTFHVTLRNGIIVAFTKRILDVLEEVEEANESVVTLDKSQTSAVSATDTIKTPNSANTIHDEEFAYDMKLSLPNGLILTTVRNILKPCYIKQQYHETSRLFLPNGNIIEISEDQIQILKADATVVMTSQDPPTLKTYRITTPEGIECIVEDGDIVSKTKLTLFQNTDMESSTTYYRRGDGACYMFQKDGTMCVLFKDGTKISATPFIGDDPYSDDTLEDECFVFVQMEVTMEHPDYATVIYNTQTQTWRVLLPFNTSITTNPDGSYLIRIDTQTELRVDPVVVEMTRFPPNGGVVTATADFSVFDDGPHKIYCRMTDSSGKTFVVEPNSNCYVLNDIPEGEFHAEDDGESCQGSSDESKLSRDNKYFVVRRDMTGFELLHTEDVKKLITTPGVVVFQPEVDPNIRIFVLIYPSPTPGGRKWEVRSILPNPKFVPGVVKTETTSTYGVPPSWTHPFPKRKKKLEMPSQLTCRVFVEINRTDLEPRTGIPDPYCQIEDYEFSKPDSLQEYVTRLTNDDQDILRGMYITAVREAMNKANPKPNPEGSEALKQYLAESERVVALQKYHQKCIRYHIVPNYFEHPIGMSWLILNGIIDGLVAPEDQKRRPVRSRLPSPRSFKSLSTFSNEEIEYNMSVSSERSYSDLTCRTDLSLKSAPTVLMSGNVCTCKIRAAAVSESAPIYRMKDGRSSESRVDMPREGICTIPADALEGLGKPVGGESVSMTLSNLMSLGLI